MELKLHQCDTVRVCRNPPHLKCHVLLEYLSTFSFASTGNEICEKDRNYTIKLLKRNWTLTKSFFFDRFNCNSIYFQNISFLKNLSNLNFFMYFLLQRTIFEENQFFEKFFSNYIKMCFKLLWLFFLSKIIIILAMFNSL